MRLLPDILLGSVFAVALYLSIRYGIPKCISKLRHISTPRCILSNNDTELVRIHFADKTTDEIPLLAFQELFSLPPNYLCSSTQVIDATGSSATMKTFFVECCHIRFYTFLHTLHQFIAVLIEPLRNNLQDNSDPPICDFINNEFSKSKRLQYDYETASSILCTFVENGELRSWLTRYIEGKEVNCLYAIDILKNWDSDYQFAYPVVFLEDLSYELNGELTSVTLNNVNSANHSSKIDSGGLSTCFQVNFKSSYQEQPDYQPFVFKRLMKHQFNSAIRFYLREFSILQRGGVVSREKYSVPYAVVVESSKNCTPVGYLMEMAEQCDLFQFLENRPDDILTNYFIKQLFELAKAIDNLHKHGIFHLNIMAKNIFVRKPTVNDTDDGNDYEFILGEFSLSGMKEWDLKCWDDFKENMNMYPPELFPTFPLKIPCESYSDFYMFRMMLNSLTTIFNNPTITAKIGYFFSHLINGICTFHPAQRLGFAEVDKYFNYILENHDPNMCVMRYPRDKDGNVPTWLYKPENPDPNSDYSIFVEEYKSCNFEYVHFIIDLKNRNQALPKQVHGKTTHVGQIVIYEFQCDYSYAISLPQTNHQKKYFFKGSLLLFESEVFCYAEFYNCEDEDKVGITIATYDYLEIVGMINFEGTEFIKRVEQQ